MIQSILNKKISTVILLIIIGLLTIALLYLGLVTHPAPDTNYYLSIAKDVIDGYIPTYNVDTEYTPFVYYILAVFLFIFGDSYATAVFATFVFTLANSILIYYLFKMRLKLSLKWSLLFLSIYIFSLFRLTTFYVLLEPFQVLFALISFILLTSSKKSITVIALSGISMGTSIMCKQYSALFAIGVGLWMLLEFYKGKYTFKDFLINGTIWSLGVLLPYFLFVVITKATLYGSLISFGFIGGAANTYAAYKPSILKIGSLGLLKVFILHMIEILPFIVYPIYRRFVKIDKNISMIADGIYLIGLLSLVSIYVRQYAHYFQLILPWAIMLWALMISDSWKKLTSTNTKQISRYLVFICFAFTLPAVFYMSPNLFYYHFKTNAVESKSYEIDFTKEALQVFETGSSVYVRGNSLLYVSCGYRNPTHNYYFTSPALMISDGKVPEVIDKVIIPKLPTHLFEQHKLFFMQHGFQIINDKEYGLYLIRNN